MNRRIRRRRGENTRSVHLPAPEPPQHRPLGLPVWRSAAWGFGDSAECADVFEEKSSGYAYGRIDNPTTAAFASAVASLEGAAAHVASTTHRRLGEASGIDEAAVRFSIGLEDAEDLIMDVTKALDSLPASGR